jgi:acyl-coenzyme A synthetase/AMP-(fatty) acid ligase
VSAPEPRPSALLDEVLVDGAATVLSHSVDITVADVADRAEHWARILREKGVGPGCAVALQIAPSHTLIYLVLAVWRLDAQVMLIDYRLAQAETDAILDIHRPYAYLRDAKAAGQGVMTSFVEDREIDIEVREHTPADPSLCLVQFTSGTSGRPKAVGRTVRGLLEEVARFDTIEGCVEPGERVLLLNSQSHTFGLVGGIMHVFRRGGRLYFPRRGDGPNIARALREYEPTVVFGVPFHFELMTAMPSVSLKARIAVSGGELISPAVGQAFADRFGVPVGEAYGMTETGILAADYPGRLPGTVGVLLEGVRHRVVDGQLEVGLDRSPYPALPDSDRFRDGWFKTCDLAQVRDEQAGSVLVLGGRADRLVAVGGLKVDLGEVEDVLLQHPDVRVAVAVMGRVIEAYVEASEGCDGPELLGWCRERLAAYKVPKSVTVTPALPRTASGKLKRDLAAMQGLAASRSGDQAQ